MSRETYLFVYLTMEELLHVVVVVLVVVAVLVVVVVLYTFYICIILELNIRNRHWQLHSCK